MASWLVRSTPERAVLVRARAVDIMLCLGGRQFTLTVMPLSSQVYKWVPANSMHAGVLASRSGGVKILSVSSCYRNRDKLCGLMIHLACRQALLLFYDNISELKT